MSKMLGHLIISMIIALLIASRVEARTFGPTTTGDKLWDIAAKVSPDSSLTRQQVIIALLRTNPQAFRISCNINSLKIKQVLRVPTLAEIQILSRDAAKAEYNRQNDEWKTYRKQGKAISCSEVTPQSPLSSQATEATTKPTEKIGENVAKKPSTAEAIQASTSEGEKKSSTPNVDRPKTTENQGKEPVSSSQQPEGMAFSTIPSAVSTREPTAASENLTTPPQGSTDKPTEDSPFIPIREENNESTQSATVADVEPKTPSTPGGIIALLAVIGVALALLIGWLLHQYSQRKDSPYAEELEHHPLFDTVDRELLVNHSSEKKM